MIFNLPANNFMNELENTLTYLLTPIGNAYWSILEKSMNDINLHSGQVFILISLFSNDGQSQIEISKNLNLAPPTVNKMIKSLIENGIVEGRKDDNDGRIMRIFLTEKGFEFESLIKEQWLKVETQLLLNFTETEKLILFQLFNKLKMNLIGNAVIE